MRDVLTASCDAPILFQTPVRLGIHDYVDGALGANCPLEVAIPRLKERWRQRDEENEFEGSGKKEDPWKSAMGQENNESRSGNEMVKETTIGKVSSTLNETYSTNAIGINSKCPKTHRKYEGNDASNSSTKTSTAQREKRIISDEMKALNSSKSLHGG